MKILQINSFSNGSTGKIMMSIHKKLLENGHESYVVWGRGRKSKNEHEIYLNDKIGTYLHVLYSRITGKNGFSSALSTKRLLKTLDDLKPDIIHLHNIHGYYINIDLLFHYLKENNIKVIWTLHDCWSFTGQCAYFDMANCNKWQKSCYNCPQLKSYPKSFKDNSIWNYKKKKELFNGLNLTLVTPSKWLSNLVRKSYLKNYDVIVINNGIDTNIFKPTTSNFRKNHNILNKKVILGIANVWDKRKGLDDFLKLSKVLNTDYVIVLIGLSKKQIELLPNNIIGITRTENQQELVEIYSTSDILFNPTYEDNYPTVNLEAIACGTPVLSYDTGGSIEFTDFIEDNKDNYIISKEEANKNINYVKDKIENIINGKFNLKDLKMLNEDTMVSKYMKLYNNVFENK